MQDFQDIYHPKLSTRPCPSDTGGVACTKMCTHIEELSHPCDLPGHRKENESTSIMPIPVGRAFHHVGVDIMELPLTAKGNRYVATFVYYLTK